MELTTTMLANAITNWFYRYYCFYSDKIQFSVTTMTRWMCLLFLCVAVGAIDRSNDEWLEVKIEQGLVRGYLDSSGELWTFLNIPYATAPKGKNKFKAPLPPPKWTETFDAVDKGIICPQLKWQFGEIPGQLKMQEDCLIANIYVPDTRKKNLSVYVHVHGGAFQLGFGDMIKAKNLLKYKDFIVVTFNYRLTIHGFLCLGTEDIPGNAGMKDQVALLKWVQQNIAAFGGNPNDVTIDGASAGSISVDLLAISKSAEGLFHKVIPESGSNMGSFATQPNPLQNAKDYAKTLNFTNVDDIYQLEEFYKTLSYDTLLSQNLDLDASYFFTPCVEQETGDGAFLTESPYSILKSGNFKKVPMLYGFSNMEGLFRIRNFEISKIRMNQKFSNYLPADLKFESEDEKERVAKEVKEFYFGDRPVDDDTVLGYVDFFSDVIFVQSSLWAVKLYVNSGHDQIYLYEYSFTDEDTPPVIHTNIRGATHCAQTFAVYDGKNLSIPDEDDLTEEYRTMKKLIREIWHNFVKTGKPVPGGSSLPSWPPVGADTLPYMSLGRTVELRGSPMVENRTRFWENIYQKYYQEPMSPP